MNLPSCSKESNIGLDIENFNNILTKTRRLIEDCTERAENWQARVKEYEELKKSLEWISSETRHSVMVPFGSCAFVPGKMVHTNEIMVLLGDNWFVERSTDQATDIVNRRIDYCNSMLNKIWEEKKLFTDKISALSDLNADVFAADGIEIREYIDDEVSQNTVTESILSTIAEEKNEDDEDRPASQDNIISNTTTAESKKISESEYRTLMSHLDDLMRNEEEEDEELRSNSSSDDQNHLDAVGVMKTVDLRETDEQLVSPGPIDSERGNVTGKTVKWKESEEEEAVKIGSEGKFTSAKKSILKNSHESSPIDQELLNKMDISERGPAILPGSIEAFSGIINEKSAKIGKLMSETPGPTPPRTRMSKFKMQRSAMQ